MNLVREVKKRLDSYMKENGFQVHNRTYYFIKHDVAYCISFEQPGGWMYTWAHVNPLYIPHESVFFSYGNRLSNMTDVNLPPLRKGTVSLDIDNWCESFCRCMSDYILPFFQHIDTPQKLIAYMKQSERDVATRRICCSPVWDEKLKMYTYLYLHDLEKAEATTGSYQMALQDSNMIASVREKLLSNVQEIRRLIIRGDEAVTVFCNQTISNTRLFFE